MLSDSSSSISSIEFVHEIEEPPMEQQAQMRPLIQENHRYTSVREMGPEKKQKLMKYRTFFAILQNTRIIQI